MTQTPEALFDAGIERYKSGEGPDTLIPEFKQICEISAKNSAAWTCLAWLYLLADKPALAYKAAQKAVKLNPQDPQARTNMAIAMLETGHKGVREHVELVQRLIMAVPEFQEEVKQNIEDGLSRKPDWKSLIRIKGWLFEES